MSDQSFLHIALIYLAVIRSSFARLLPKGRKKAKKSKWRVSEATLLGLAVVGGSVGAWLGMKTWHHKTLHRKFRYGVPLILIAQIALFLLCSCRFGKDNKQTSVFILSTSSEVFISSDATSQKSDIR